MFCYMSTNVHIHVSRVIIYLAERVENEIVIREPEVSFTEETLQ